MSETTVSSSEAPVLSPLSMLKTGDQLLDQSAPLLAMISYFSRAHLIDQPVDDIRNRLAELLNSLSYDLDSEHSNHEIFLWIAATLDEQLQRIAGDENLSRKTLVSQLYHRRDAGNHCFTLLQKWMLSPEVHPSHLTIAYLCLKCGFQGMYRRQPSEKIHELQIALYKLLKQTGFCTKTPFTLPVQRLVTKRRWRFTPTYAALCTLITMMFVVALVALWCFSSQPPVLDTLRRADQSQHIHFEAPKEASD